MALIFVTGPPGVGKSAVEQELRARGETAYDADDVGAAYDNASGAVVDVPPVRDRTREWFASHSWRIRRDRLVALEREAAGMTIFLCGSASNEDEIWDLFDLVIVLDVDARSLKRRLGSRTDNDYGKNDFELEEILSRHGQLTSKYRGREGTMIDASRPLALVVQDVVASSDILKANERK